MLSELESSEEEESLPVLVAAWALAAALEVAAGTAEVEVDEAATTEVARVLEGAALLADEPEEDEPEEEEPETAKSTQDM